MFSLQTAMHITASQLVPCIIILVLLGLDLGMAIASYKQFGWRMYSKIACDFRTKSGSSRQRTYLFIHSFLTTLKVDLLVRMQFPQHLWFLLWPRPSFCLPATGSSNSSNSARCGRVLKTILFHHICRQRSAFLY